MSVLDRMEGYKSKYDVEPNDDEQSELHTYESAEGEQEIKKRTPQESERDLIAPYVAEGYIAQYSSKLDENGNVVPAEWGEKGSRRPDAYDPETNTVIEVKNYKVETASGRNNLANNIRKQTDMSKYHYGDDVNTIEVKDLKGHDVTVEDMEKLTDKLQEKCPEIGLDYRW